MDTGKLAKYLLRREYLEASAQRETQRDSQAGQP
jgi:hypothetical protein